MLEKLFEMYVSEREKCYPSQNMSLRSVAGELAGMAQGWPGLSSYSKLVTLHITAVQVAVCITTCNHDNKHVLSLYPWPLYHVSLGHQYHSCITLVMYHSQVYQSVCIVSGYHQYGTVTVSVKQLCINIHLFISYSFLVIMQPMWRGSNLAYTTPSPSALKNY